MRFLTGLSIVLTFVSLFLAVWAATNKSTEILAIAVAVAFVGASLKFTTQGRLRQAAVNPNARKIFLK